MANNLSYMMGTQRFSIFKCVFILCFYVFFQQAAGECGNKCKKVYVADEFGYMTIDEEGKTVNIFKTTFLDDVYENIARCRIKDTTDGYFTISSLQPLSYRELDIRVSEEYRQSPDSVLVRINLPPEEAEGLYIMVYPSVGPHEKYCFSSNGTVEFRLRKFGFKYDNFFSVVIFPKIYPFRKASSWADCETLSFLDLRIDEILDVTDPDLSELKIYIPDFTKNIFRYWVLLDDFVLKDNSDIIWRNIRFIESNKE